MLPRLSRRAASLAMLLLLVGCWDRQDIEERATSLMTGVDLCEPPDDCAILSTRQFAIPGRIPLGPGNRGDVDTVFVLRSPGANGPDTTRSAQEELHREISFAHTRLLVWSEAFAKQGLATYLDYVWRIPEVRRIMWVAVVEGRAERLVAAKPELDPVPALYLNDLIEESVDQGRLPAEVTLGDFMVRLSNPGEDPFVPLLRVSDPNYPEIYGLAVFRDAAMVGRLNSDELATFQILRGQHGSTQVLRVAMPGEQWARIGIFGNQVERQVRYDGERIHVHFRLALEGDLLHLSPEVRGSDPATISLIEERAAADATRRLQMLTDKLQKELGADILSLGAHVRAFLPGAWSRIPDWRAAFAAAQITLEVTVNVRRTGPVMD